MPRAPERRNEPLTPTPSPAGGTRQPDPVARSRVLRELAVEGAVLRAHDLRRRLPGLSLEEIEAVLDSLVRDGHLEASEPRYRVRR